MVPLLHNLSMSTQTPRHRLRVPILDAHAFVFRRHLSFVPFAAVPRLVSRSLASRRASTPRVSSSSIHPSIHPSTRVHHRPSVRRSRASPPPRGARARPAPAHRILRTSFAPCTSASHASHKNTSARIKKNDARQTTLFVSPRRSRRPRAVASTRDDARRRRARQSESALSATIARRRDRCRIGPPGRARPLDDAPSAVQKTTASVARHAAHVGIDADRRRFVSIRLDRVARCRARAGRPGAAWMDEYLHTPRCWTRQYVPRVRDCRPCVRDRYIFRSWFSTSNTHQSTVGS